MLFFIRSAFWLGIVYSAMPFDNIDQTRELARLRAELAAAAGNAAAAACPGQSVSFRALALAMQGQSSGAATGVSAEPKARAARKSADSLTPADLMAPWRGALAKRAERQALAKPAAMPI
jgi:hypothetical protein